MRKIFSAAVEAEVVAAKAAGERVKSVARRLGVDIGTVYACLHRAGVACDNRRSLLNEAAFDDVSGNPAAQYFVGLLMADGSVKESNRGQVTVTLALKEGDRASVEAFRDFVGSDLPVKLVANARAGGYNAHRPERRLASLTLTSKRMAAALATVGVVRNKSAREVAHPQLAESGPFWRGMVDGDGWVTWGSQKRCPPFPVLGLTGSRTVLEQFVRYTHANGSRSRVAISPNHSIWKVQVTGTNAVPVVRALYGDGGPALARKLAVARDAMLWQRTQPDRSALTLEVIDRLREEHGGYAAAAATLGMSYAALVSLRHHRSKAKRG